MNYYIIPKYYARVKNVPVILQLYLLYYTRLISLKVCEIFVRRVFNKNTYILVYFKYNPHSIIHV